MICLHTYYSDGDEIFTRINATEQEAIDYYADSRNNGFVTTELYFPISGWRYSCKRETAQEVGASKGGKDK